MRIGRVCLATAFLSVLFLCQQCHQTIPNPVLTPIQQVGCAIETAVTGTFASGVASALTCTNQTQIQADLQKAFGNANLCTTPVPSTTTSSAVTAMSATKTFKTVGDVSSDDLKNAKSGMHAQSLHPMGIVGNIACPIAVSTAMGFLSNSIPAAWGCSANAQASTLVTSLVSLCEAAIPL